jgi:hypothetical protein
MDDEGKYVRNVELVGDPMIDGFCEVSKLGWVPDAMYSSCSALNIA